MMLLFGLSIGVWSFNTVGLSIGVWSFDRFSITTIFINYIIEKKNSSYLEVKLLNFNAIFKIIIKVTLFDSC